MIRQEKLEYLAFGRPEYLLNLLSKHNLKITSVRVKEDGIKFKITATDKLKLEQIFKNYGKKYELVKRNGWAINAGKIGKNLAFFSTWSACRLIINKMFTKFIMFSLDF